MLAVFYQIDLQKRLRPCISTLTLRKTPCLSLRTLQVQPGKRKMRQKKERDAIKEILSFWNPNVIPYKPVLDSIRC